MNRENLHRLRAGLLVSLGLFLFLYASACAETEARRSGSNHIPIHLAVGTFDPLSDSGPMALPADLALESYPENEVGYYILQFKGPVLERWKKQIVSTGGIIFDYIPQFAFIVRMNDQTRESVRAMDSIRWIGIYQPGYRIAPDLWSSVTEKGDEPVDLTVSVFTGEDVRAFASHIHRLGGEIVDISEASGRIRVKIALKRVPDVARLTGVKWIERVSEFKIFPPIKRSVQE